MADRFYRELADTLYNEGDGLSVRASEALMETTSDDYLLARIKEKISQLSPVAENLRLRPNKTEREQAIMAASAALYVAMLALERLNAAEGD